MKKTDSVLYVLAVVLLLLIILFYLQTYKGELMMADVNNPAPVPTAILSIIK